MCVKDVEILGKGSWATSSVRISEKLDQLGWTESEQNKGEAVLPQVYMLVSEGNGGMDDRNNSGGQQKQHFQVLF